MGSLVTKTSAVAIASPDTPRVGRLDTPSRCRRELARVYREARQGTLPTHDATRLANILYLVARLAELDMLDGLAQRMARLAGRGGQT
jgi:hypothetical protein